MQSVWNPWHGCKKVSAGCMNCYVYRMDKAFGKDSSIVEKTNAFDYPIKKNQYGEYKLKSSDSPVYVCLSSDFLIEQADEWRSEIWDMIKERGDIDFKIITKRIERLTECMPEDWGEGYENVTLICTCENQEMADKRLPVFLEMPIKHREIIHEPMLESINISRYLESGKIEKVSCGGESGENARVCEYDWIVNTRNQCVLHNVTFVFRQTGANFIFREISNFHKRKKRESISNPLVNRSMNGESRRYSSIMNRKIMIWKIPLIVYFCSCRNRRFTMRYI